MQPWAYDDGDTSIIEHAAMVCACGSPGASRLFLFGTGAGALDALCLRVATDLSSFGPYEKDTTVAVLRWL
jgi:hypothetical protein